MAYSDSDIKSSLPAADATKTWISATPKKNAGGNVIKWRCKYRYELNDFGHTYEGVWRIETPSRTPEEYTKSELLIGFDKPRWDKMFSKMYALHISGNWASNATIDESFDVSTLNN